MRCKIHHNKRHCVFQYLLPLISLNTIQAVPAESCSTLSVIATPSLTYHSNPAISTQIITLYAAPSSPPPPSTPYASHSYVAGVGIRSSVKAGIEEGFDPDIIWDGIQAGVSSGIVEVGVSLLDNINPGVYQMLKSTGIMRAAENILDNDELFNGVFNVLSQIVPTAFNMANYIATNIFEGALTFYQLVMENKMLGAVDTALNSLFTGETIASVMDHGGVEDILSRPFNEVILPDGREAQEITLTNDASLYLDMEGDLISVKEQGMTSTGSFIWTQEDGLRLESGTIQGTMETGYSIWADIDSGKALSIEILNSDGGQEIKIDPEKEGFSIDMSSIFNAATSEYSFTLINAFLSFANTYSARIHDETVESISQKVNAISAGSLFNDTNKFLYALANGICNPSYLSNPPQYISNLKQDILDHSNSNISTDDIFSVVLYKGLTSLLPLNGIIDALKWLAESQNSFIIDNLADKVQTGMVSYFVQHAGDWNRPIVGMGYSGGFIPFIEGVSHLVYNVKTVVGLGGPSAFLNSELISVIIQILQSISDGLMESAKNLLKAWGYGDSFISDFITTAQDSTNAVFPYIKEIMQDVGALINIGPDTFSYSLTKTDLIVNVWGSEDIFHKIGVVDKRDNFLGKTTYNIEIVGAGHFDYIREIDPNNPNPTWNNTVANFVTDLMIASEDVDKLGDFIAKKIKEKIVSYDTVRGVYIVKLPGSDI